MISITSDSKEALKTIPALPGIYKMYDSRQALLYIGKSKCLMKRVKSYFHSIPKQEKIKKMVSAIHFIDYIVTDTHLEARLLECDLIKTNKPPFNSQMKNDRNYTYLKLNASPSQHPISLSGERTEASYGPFRRKYALDQLIHVLENLYPIHEDNSSYEFEYHLFPVEMDAEDFHKNHETLRGLLSEDQKMEQFIRRLEDKMNEASSLYRFETASIYRDLQTELQYLQNALNGYRDLFSRNIILKIPFHQGIKLFFVSKGNILYKEVHTDLSKKALQLFIRNGKKQEASFDAVLTDEKAGIDFRDILYSEIMSLPEEMVEYLS